ncbi:MAG: N-acetyl sugar amidotransferase [Pirellulaceae bacterium]
MTTDTKQTKTGMSPRPIGRELSGEFTRQDAAHRGSSPRTLRMCTRCIMDESDPEITFDDQGHCNHCIKYFVRAQSEQFTGIEAEQRLQRLVANIQREGHGRDYDCVIGVSGGVDSTYVAYRVRQLGLRPLAVHLDNGWNSELAVDNIKRTLDCLDIDLHTHVIDWPEFRDLQLSFLKASVPNCEIPTDHAILALLIQTARRYRLRYILTGSNLSTEGIMPSAWGYLNQDLRHLRAIHRRFGTRRLRTLPQLSLPGFLTAVLAQGIRYVPILNMMDYDKCEAKELIHRELGWRDYGGKHYESIFTRFFQGYILPVKFGFDKRRAHLSTMICSGLISRAQALREMELDAYGSADLNQDREFVIKKFGLTEDEFADLMKQPPKRHAEYPSYAFYFHHFARGKQWFKRIATAA